MLIRTTLLCSAIGLLVIAGPANASHNTGWYFGVEAGANWIADADVDVDTIDPFFGGGFPPAVNEFDGGWVMMGTLGHAWNNVRIELELGYRENEFDSSASAGVFTGTGEFNEFSQMVNLVYDCDIGPRWNLSLGGGIGGDSISYKNNLHSLPIDDEDYVFAWQLMAGIGHAIAPGVDLVLNYRYFNASEPEFIEIEPGGILHNDTFDNIGKHTVTIGLRMDINPD